MIQPVRSVAETSLDSHGGPQGKLDGDLPPVMLDFSSNINAFGPAPAVIARLKRLDPGPYPDPDSVEVRRAVSRLWEIPEERVRFSGGTVELIHRLARVFIAPDDPALVIGPTFGEYARAVSLAGGFCRTLTRGDPEDGLPLSEARDQIEKYRPRLVFLCTPNNPTGELVERLEIEALIDTIPDDGLLVLDESYASFACGDFQPPSVPNEDRVIRVRSVTKDFALGGVRAGFAVGPPQVLDALDRGGVPWVASSYAQEATIAALQPDSLAYLRKTLRMLTVARAELIDGLSGVGWKPLPSVTNFVLSKVDDAVAQARALRASGVRVRDCMSFGLPGYIRVAVRKPTENHQLIDTIGRVQCST